MKQMTITPAAAPDPRKENPAMEQAFIQARGADVFYGDKQALFGIDLDIEEKRSHLPDRAVWLRQIHLPAGHQPDERPDPHLPVRPAA